MPDASLIQALQSGPQAAIEWMREALRAATDERDELANPSEITQIIHAYEHELGLGDRELMQRTFRSVLEQTARGIANDSAQQQLPHLLYLGTQIMPQYDPKLRREIGISVRNLIKRALRSQNLRSALFGLNFICDTGLGLDLNDLDAYAEQIGAPAYLPAFMIISRQSPRDAIPWLLRKTVDRELIVNTVRTGIETLCYSEQLAGSSEGLSRTQAWLMSENETAISEIDDERLSANLRMALKGKVPDLTHDYSQEALSYVSPGPASTKDTIEEGTLQEIEDARERGFGSELEELVGVNE